jgi:hypothetical protein
MVKRLKLAEELEAIYRDSLGGPFPYRDCRWLADRAGFLDGDLIPEFDYYFATVAGYGSSATRLFDRSPADLLSAKMMLAKDFFERHPNLEVCRLLIDPECVPDLSRQMAATEKFRVGLLELLSVLQA